MCQETRHRPSASIVSTAPLTICSGQPFRINGYTVSSTPARRRKCHTSIRCLDPQGPHPALHTVNAGHQPTFRPIVLHLSESCQISANTESQLTKNPRHVHFHSPYQNLLDVQKSGDDPGIREHMCVCKGIRSVWHMWYRGERDK